MRAEKKKKKSHVEVALIVYLLSKPGLELITFFFPVTILTASPHVGLHWSPAGALIFCFPSLTCLGVAL